jgi:hypothetical protein
MTVALGPFHFLSFSGGIGDLAAGQERPDALGDLDERLPRPNSLRRAHQDAKVAVLAGAQLLRSAGVAASERLGLYVGQQHMTFDYCSQFLDGSYRDGPRMASPMLFSEGVLNNVATHLSLTLGVKGVAQTFIGTRVAALQALLAAAEDVEEGVVEAGLVVGLGVANSLSQEAYHSLYHPLRRRHRPDLHFLRGSVAMLVRRDAPGQPRMVFGAVRCLGGSPQARLETLGSLWKDASVRIPKGTRIVESTLRLARDRSLDLLRRIVPTISLAEGLGEGFALDPFARLLLDGVRHPGTEGRAVLCLSEEGTAAMLALDGPPRLAVV